MNLKGTPRHEFTRIVCECRWFLPNLPTCLGKEIDCRWKQEKTKKRHRTGQLSISEITPALAAGASVTIIIYFHQSRYRNFKAYYIEYVSRHLRGEFPNLVSYERFVILMPSAFGPLSAYLKSLYGNCSGISFIDSTALEVCDNHRIHNHKVFEGIAERGKGSMAGFTVWKFTWWSMIAAKSWLAKSHLGMWMTANLFLLCVNACLASWSQIVATSLNLYSSSCWKLSTCSSSHV